MAHTSSTERQTDLTTEQRQLMLDLAARSIRNGIERGEPLAIDPADYAPELRVPRAAFVSLHLDGALLACVGTIKPALPLVVNVATKAFDAAFRDPRFSGVERSQLDRLDIEISILGPLEPME